MLMQPVPEGLHPVEGTHSAAIQGVHSVGRGISWRIICHGRDLLLDQEKSVRRKEGQRQREELIACILHSPVPLREGGREFGNKFEPTKKKEVGEDVFKIWFYSSLSYSDFKLN